MADTTTFQTFDSVHCYYEKFAPCARGGIEESEPRSSGIPIRIAHIHRNLPIIGRKRRASLFFPLVDKENMARTKGMMIEQGFVYRKTDPVDAMK
uniref:Uncharacterized protein n=1 Tax=Candidatus Kentrum sp. LFY TaxID=2126342 RepID=A0A450U4X6_9GAMM|nr:MAG: hypothetical protein BECKLFY1418B_GA0070995_1001100 [Candidatus Kentron sp. LFY]